MQDFIKPTLKPVKRDILTIRYKGVPVRIAYFIRPGQENTILSVHGLGSSKNDFARALRVHGLARYSIAAFDFPGCGNSPYTEDMAFNVDDLVEITHLLVSDLSLKDVIFVGHSMGGLVSLLYAERYSEYIKALVNVEGNLSPDDCFFSRVVTGYGPEGFTEEAFEKFRQQLAQSNKPGIREYAGTLYKSANRKAYADYSCSIVDYCDNIALLNKFITLSIPKLFIYGSQNRQIPYLTELEKQGCPLKEVPESGHFPAYDNPRSYYAIIADFITSLR
jgi:pimeloyl-ACP methyl ester carboxylesterase